MKLFSMDEYETWIGPDYETTRAAYLKELGDTEEARAQLEDGDGEYSEAQLDTFMVDTSDEGDGSGPMVTARQLLATEIANGGEFPRLAFCCE